MTATKSIVLAILVLFAVPAQASGYRPPVHSQLTYSFTCPSGSSGHITYTKDFVTDPSSRLTIWVNGNYIQEKPDIASALNVRNIEQVQASCAGDGTVIVVETFDPSRPGDQDVQRVTLHVDLAGNVSPLDG